METFKLTKAQKAELLAYVVNGADNSDYSGELYDYLTGLKFIFCAFYDEKGKHSQNDFDALEYWLSGLPNCLSYVFTYRDIEQWLFDAVHFENLTKKKKADIVENWFSYIAAVLLEAFERELSPEWRKIAKACIDESCGILASTCTYNHGRDIYGNVTAHYTALIYTTNTTLRLSTYGKKRQQVGYGGENSAAVYAIEKLGFNVDLSNKTSYDYQGVAVYKVYL